MPGITDYQGLLAEVADWLNRTDLTAKIPTFVANAEARFRRELKRWLRIPRTYTNVGGDLALESDVDKVTSVALNDGAGGLYNHPLEHLTRNDYQRLMGQSSVVRSPVWAVFVDYNQSDRVTTLRFYPPASSTSPIAKLQVDVVQRLPSLSDSVTSNTLLVEAPDLYLRAALADAAPYLQHDERLPVWQEEVTHGIEQLEKQAADRLYGATPRRLTLPVVF